MPSFRRALAWPDRTAKHRAEPRGRDDGFTLLEVLVALGILGMSLTILFAVFTTALDRTGANRNRVTAERLAHALLLQAETADPAEVRDAHGMTSLFEWSVKTSPFGTDEDRKAWQGAAVRIRVDVRWHDHGRERSLSLSTLRIVPGGRNA